MITWATAFLDSTAADWDRTLAFWQAATASTLSPFRGPDDEFVTLVPADGDGYLRAQRVRSGPGGVHLDLHVPDTRAAADAAVLLGAREVAASDHVVLTSPGGLAFCFVDAYPARRPAPVTWPHPEGGTYTSLVDQLAVDVPADRWDAERRFWAELTGWPEQPTAPGAALVPLRRPDGLPLRLLLQRLDEPDGPVRAHLDLACSDRGAETDRHVALGAQVEAVRERWTVLRDPAGRRYCLTDRDPATGGLP
ncbi:VOC family protein [Cellulomonas sp. IC4_254]|uniref:VOC family protein n=1 Tax=Cellulomonas sp. IC4_254 TaxID=2714040 RepID=UPI001420223D|nr:VOC family protein [Cellulomonas sp. IC4_254]NHT17627.1 VOC family protein [Cellulomonas sp. IC4_254]